MKKITTFLIATFICFAGFSQAKATTAEFQKTIQPGLTTDVPYAEKTVSKALDDKMGKLGYKGKDTKGYLTYKGVRINEIGPEAYDFYFKVERKSKKEKDVSVVTLLISSGYEKFIADSSNNTMMANAKTFLNNLTQVVEAYDLEQQIADQEAIATKESKKYINLTNDGQDLQKKKQKLENEIADNLKDQAKQKLEAEKQNQILETLKMKRKK